jgi:gamma-glutamylcyclotransferase
MNDDVWYFAYGSNLWIDQKERRTSAIRTGADRPRIARLADHRFAFNKRGRKGQVYANVMACPGEEVFGVVYRCKPSTVDTMSEWEGGYDRKIVTVVIDDGSSVEAITYVAMEKNVLDDTRPSDEYLTRILTGAAQHGLPQEYIEKIRLLATACGGNS